MSQPIPVRAKVLGFYDGGRKRAGTEFTVRDESEVGSWMERLDTAKKPKVEKEQKDK